MYSVCTSLSSLIKCILRNVLHIFSLVTFLFKNLNIFGANSVDRGGLTYQVVGINILNDCANPQSLCIFIGTYSLLHCLHGLHHEDLLAMFVDNPIATCQSADSS